MKKRALVVGSERDGLRGVHNDVSAIASRLSARGFELDVRQQDNACRDGILEGYARLIRNSESGDAALFYYSGHGCRLVNPSAQRERPFIQCLVPIDWDARGAFRGIFDLELSRLLLELTGKTRNVACVFDCCHAATMCRDTKLLRAAKFSMRDWNDSTAEVLSAVVGDAGVPLHAESNPCALRLAASESDRSAYEAEHELGGVPRPMGHFTWALATALDEMGETPVPWSSLMARVRELVLRLEPLQVPQLEGPGERLLFSTDTTKRRDAVVFYFDCQARPMIRAARLLGAVPGVQYDVLPADAPECNGSAVIATATVLANEGPSSHVAIEPNSSARAPRAGDLAFPRSMPFPKLSITWSGSANLVEALCASLSKSRFLCKAGEEEAAALHFSLEGSVRLIQADGSDVVKPRDPTVKAVVAAVEAAERWSRAQVLLTLQSNGIAQDVLAIRWGRVENGQRVPMMAGEPFYLGDRPYIDIDNCSPEPLWIAVFDVGVTGKISLLTAATPTGQKLEPRTAAGSSYTLGAPFGALTGFGPGVLPADAPDYGPSAVALRAAPRESFVVVASQHAADFFLLQTSEPRASTRSQVSDFSDVLDWVREGSYRDFGGTAESHYGVQRIDFAFVPATRGSSTVPWTPPRGVLAAVGPRRDCVMRRLTEVNLRPADLLLSLGTGHVSEAIQSLDGGWYSHVALWTADGVIESTDEGVRRCSFAESVSHGHRQHVDVYRHKRISAAQCARVVRKASEYVGRTYSWGDLFMGAMLVSTGAFLFRTREEDQQRWLWAMQSLNRFFLLDRERAEDLVTCAGLVASSYYAAGLPIAVNLVGLRRCEGAALFAAVRELASFHARVSKGQEILTELSSFQSRLLDLSGGPIWSALPDETLGSSVKRVKPVGLVGIDWGANLVSPRDLMQSDDFDLIGSLYP